MNNKKNKLLTVIFSLIPGAGHMYIGLMRRGVSLMGIFCLVIMFLTLTSTGVGALVLPIIWFYSFFDLWNKVGLPPEKFARVRDRFLFLDLDGEDADTGIQGLVGRHSKSLGVFTILMGVYILWNNVFSRMAYACFGYGTKASYLFEQVGRSIPMVAVAALIIALGIRLIVNKKNELDGGDGQ